MLHKRRARVAAIAATLLLVGCSTTGPGGLAGRVPGILGALPDTWSGRPLRLRASWYGQRFAGKVTASGQRFDPDALTAAHPSLPFGTVLRVRNPANGRSVMVTVTDRGPSIGGRELDLSLAAARRLRITGAGVVTVDVEIVSRGRGGR